VFAESRARAIACSLVSIHVPGLGAPSSCHRLLLEACLGFTQPDYSVLYLLTEDTSSSIPDSALKDHLRVGDQR